MKRGTREGGKTYDDGELIHANGRDAADAAAGASEMRNERRNGQR